MTRAHFHADDVWYGDPYGRAHTFDHINLTEPCILDDCDPATRRWVFDDAELAAFTIDITPRVLEALADETEPR